MVGLLTVKCLVCIGTYCMRSSYAMLLCFPLDAAGMGMSLKEAPQGAGPTHCLLICKCSLSSCPIFFFLFLYFSNWVSICTQQQETACSTVCVCIIVYTLYVCVVLADPYSCEGSCHLQGLFKGSGADTHTLAHSEIFSLKDLSLWQFVLLSFLWLGTGCTDAYSYSLMFVVFPQGYPSTLK